MLGQAKVCLKIDSEEEMMQLAQTATELGLINYVVVRIPVATVMRYLCLLSVGGCWSNSNRSRVQDCIKHWAITC